MRRPRRSPEARASGSGEKRRVGRLVKTNERWLRPANILAHGLGPLWLVVLPFGVPLAPVVAAVLMAWVIDISGDQLDSGRPVTNFWRGVVTGGRRLATRTRGSVTAPIRNPPLIDAQAHVASHKWARRLRCGSRERCGRQGFTLSMSNRAATQGTLWRCRRRGADWALLSPDRSDPVGSTLGDRETDSLRNPVRRPGSNGGIGDVCDAGCTG